MYVEVEPNPNCDCSIFVRFREQGPARPVLQVRLYDRISSGEWCWVIGWQDDSSNPICPAWVQPVEDSGAGMAYLIAGGNWGLRLRPVGVEEDWSLESPRQWGEAYLLLTDRRDIRFADEAGKE